MQCRFEDYLLLDGNMQQSFCPKLLLSCLVLFDQDVCKRGARYTCNTADMSSLIGCPKLSGPVKKYTGGIG